MRFIVTAISGIGGAIGLVVACSGGTATTGGSGTTYVAQSYCDQREARSKNCAADTGTPDTGTPPVPYSRTSCTKDYDCAVALMAYPDSYLRCRANPDCSVSTSDDRCLAASQTAPVPQADSCAKKYAECKAAGGKNFSNDTCGTLSALNAASLQKIYACIEKPCDQIRDCIDATVGAISPACN